MCGFVDVGCRRKPRFPTSGCCVELSRLSVRGSRSTLQPSPPCRHAALSPCRSQAITRKLFQTKTKEDHFVCILCTSDYIHWLWMFRAWLFLHLLAHPPITP